jgi:hypothetical protein
MKSYVIEIGGDEHLDGGKLCSTHETKNKKKTFQNVSMR